MIKNLEKSILKTLCYSSIFNYPLTLEELWKFMIADKPQSVQTVEKVAESSKKVDKKDGFYFLKGRKKLVVVRKKREKESKRKLEKTNLVFKLLSFIPSILLIGISGSLSMYNADKKDDIDIFVICKKNSIWTTRLSILLFLELLGVRRKRQDRNPKDKICLNMIVTEDNLKINKHTIYTAHEVAQLLVVFERNNIYHRFLNANKWVLKYLPNTSRRTKQNSYAELRETSDWFRVFVPIGSVLEFACKRFQVWYMTKHRTTETISDSILAFHPHNNEEWILSTYNKKVKKYV